jgi:ABC-type Co2+ transport system permease subunit
MLQHIQDIAAAVLKPTYAWAILAISHVASLLGNLTAAQLGAYLAIAYTSVQLYVTVRDKILKRRVGDGQL